MLVLIIIFMVLGYLYLKHQRAMNYWQDRGVKYVKPWPIVGNVYPILANKTSNVKFIQDLYNKFPKEKYFGIYQLTTPILMVRDPDLIKQILVKNFDNFVNHSPGKKVDRDPVWSKTLLGLNDDKWKRMRGTVSPLFTGSKMRMMFGLIKECSEQLVRHFTESTHEIIDVEMKDVTQRYSIDVITSCALGVQSDSIKYPHNDFAKVAKEMGDYTGLKKYKLILYGYFPLLCMLLRLKVVSNDTSRFFHRLILGTIKTRQEQKIVRPDLLHLLMKARKGSLKNDNDGYLNVPTTTTSSYISDEDVVAQSFIFVLAGVDTSSNVVFAACHELAIHPHIQTRLRDEIRATLDKYGGQMTYEGLIQMKYIDMVVSEALRKWLQANWIDRTCVKTIDIEPQHPGEKPLHIEKGQDIWIPIAGLHYDPQYFPEPDQFDPERFSDENKSKIPPFTYLPFGEGPRHCVGYRFALLSFKSFLFSLLSNFEIIPNGRTMIPLRPSTQSYLLSMDGGCQLSLKRLSSK